MVIIEWGEYIVLELRRFDIRHEVHNFPSGYKMIDIWKNDKFYCVQLEPTRIGISEVTKKRDLILHPIRFLKILTILKLNSIDSSVNDHSMNF